MSRIGKLPIALPEKVKATIQGNEVTIQGPLGAMTQAIPDGISVVQEERRLVVRRASETKTVRSLHGLVRSLLNNMARGVTEGYQKGLEIHGVGYSVSVQGQALSVDVGFAKPVVMDLPKGISVEVAAPSNPAKFTIKGYDKRLVGELAARIRRLRPPEPYQGKGVRYAGEQIRRKAGKTFAAGT